MLRVESKEKESFLTFYIFSVLDSNDKIGVYWGWSLFPEYVEGLRVTNKEVKRQLYQDLFDSSFKPCYHATKTSYRGSNVQYCIEY